MEEKQNFRAQYLHTTSNNQLILFMYLPHPSSRYRQTPASGHWKTNGADRC